MSKILVIVLLLIADTAQAAAPRALTLEGEEGVWFQRAAAERLMNDIKACRLGEEIDALYTRKIELLTAELRTHQRLLALAEQGELRATDALDRAIANKREAERSRDSWIRAPTVWFTAGVVLTLIGAGALAVTVRQ